jgi:hypothetical protein
MELAAVLVVHLIVAVELVVAETTTLVIVWANPLDTPRIANRIATSLFI